jgi:hypothetical protein
MPPKPRRRPKRFDIQRAFAAYAEASQKARAWGEKSLALRKAGMPTAAARAEEKAEHWLRKVFALKALTARGKPQGSRTEEG